MPDRSFYARYAWPIMIVLGCLFPALYWGQQAAYEHSNNNIYQWLPQDFVETRQYEDFRRRFGTDDFAVASWIGCTLDDPRLEQFALACERSEWFAKVTTGPRLLDLLTGEPLKQPLQEALATLQGTLVGPDHRITCAMVTLSEKGDTQRTAALAALRQIATGQCGIDPDDLRLGGDAVINAAIDLESQRAISQWIVVSWIVSLAVAWLCLRNVKLILMIFVVAGYSSALTTASVYYTGGTMNLVLVVVPALIYVLALSAAVHLANYYRDAVRDSDPRDAPLRAMIAGWLPCMLSALTTALGLVSLRASRILPVRDFGIYAALGVLATLVVLFGLLPSMLQKLPPWPGSQPGSGGSPLGLRDQALGGWADWLTGRRRGVMLACLGLLLFFAGGIARVDTTVASSRFFSPQSRWVKDSDWLQQNLGPMIPIEVLICFDNQSSLTFLERMELVQRVERDLHEIQPIGGTLSAATFCPAIENPPEADAAFGRVGRAALRVLGLGRRATVPRRLLDRQLLRHRDRFVEAGYLHLAADEHEEIWRISARVPAFADVDHDRLLYEQVKRRVDSLLEQQASPAGTVRAVCTGVVPLVYLSQRELLRGLYRSFCLAFAMIALVMLILLRNLWAALLVMLPNVLPAVVIFGTMGWTGKRVDVGAMMTASVALGIAVDDTLHFLTWFTRALRRGQTRPQAIAEAYQRCAPAMAQTTLIAGLGLLVFAFSSFHPVSQFGLLMFVLLLAALLGDLVLLPAMLATRLGRYFEPPPSARHPLTSDIGLAVRKRDLTA